jgi:colanic acid biosynthesis glycosyl transferase WcaI
VNVEVRPERPHNLVTEHSCRPEDKDAVTARGQERLTRLDTLAPIGAGAYRHLAHYHSQPLRILLINNYYPPDTAGTAHILGELTEDLARHHEVEVIVGRPSYNPQVETRQRHGVRVTRVPSTAFSRRTAAGRSLNYLTFTFASLARACLTRRPDVVVTMTDPPIIGVIGALTAARFRRPFVQLTHDVFPDIAVALHKIKNPVLVRLWHTLNRSVRGKADKLVVVGRDMREKLIREGVDSTKIVFIPTWSSNTIVDDAEISRIRRRMGWADTFIVMHAGNMGLPQGLFTIIDAAERLRTFGDISIVFLGDGAVKQELVGEVERRRLPNVVFLPHHTKEEAQALMAAADVHIVSLVPGLWGCATPSKTYGVMAAGRPFIAAVDPGSEPARIVEEFECGLHVPAGDAAALAEAIRTIRDAPLEEMGQRAKAGFLARYERDTATRAIRALLEHVGVTE